MPQLGRVVIALTASVYVTAGCAGRIPEPVGGHTDSPHLGWVIMSGDLDNPDRDFVCQSNPRSECTITADRPSIRMLGHVHLYYHSAATETRYSGSIRVGFFDQPHDVAVSNIAVKPGAVPGNQGVFDFVASRPGTYMMTIDVVATSMPSGVRQNIRDQVKVVIR